MPAGSRPVRWNKRLEKFRPEGPTATLRYSDSVQYRRGSEHNREGDFKRFLRISKGSCGELRTQLYIAKRVAEKLNSTDTEPPESLITETREISAMLQGLINSIDARRQDSEN